MYKQIFRQGILAALLLLSLFVTASAQEFRGSVTGKVTDPNGAAIPGATVTIKNIETNSETTATTNDEGTYNFPLLQPGKYTLTVTQQGFNTAVREGIEIKVADKLTLDVRMESGVAETVWTVTRPPGH